MSAIAKRSTLHSGMIILIVLAILWAWAGTAQGASLDVTKTADTDDGVCDVDCSLREALAVAIAGDTINVPIGTYTLTLGTELTIGVDLTLNGAGSGDTIVQAAISSADATSRVFNITGGTVAFSGVTVQNGNTSGDRFGGGIFNQGGTLTLTSSTVSSNTAGDDGGGIHNSGTLTLTGSTVSGNTAMDRNGGGIKNISTLTLTDSTISGNTASNGGGIHNSGTLTLTNSTISGNTVIGPAANGGGINNNIAGILTLTNSNISDNTGGVGGGLINWSTADLVNSTISGNTASGEGGGIWNFEGTLNLTNSTVSGNTASLDGGGIYNFPSSTLTLTNSTVSSNTADDDGGGLHNFGTATITNSTISGNTASSRGGGVLSDVGGTVESSNTIISGNTASTGPDCQNLDVFSSLGYNLIGDDADCGMTPGIGDLLNVDPLLGPLQDNSGTTETQALLSGSPAIDQIPVTIAQSPPTSEAWPGPRAQPATWKPLN